MHVCSRVAVAVLLALAVWAAAGPARAAEIATGIEHGRSLYEQGDYREALEVLRAAFRDDPGDLETSFLLGLTAAALGDPEGAAVAFERVLMMRPELDRARLELARCYAAMGLERQAEKLFAEVLAKPDVPASVRANVNTALQALRGRHLPHRLAGRLSLALVRDDNARISPDGTVAIPGFPRLDVPVERDVFYAGTLQLNHRYQPCAEGLGWETEGLAYGSLYDTADDLDLQYLSVASGPTWTADGLTLTLQALARHLQRDEDSYLTAWGGRARAAQTLTPRLALVLDLTAEDRHYPGAEDLDGPNLALACGPVWLHGPHRLQVSIGGECQDAKEAWEAYERVLARADYQLQLPWQTSLGLGYAYEFSLYDEAGPFEASRRREHLHRVSVSLHKQITPHVGMDLSHRLEKAFSANDLYDYRRQVTALSASYSF